MSKRILVVEDQEDNRKIMRDLLEANDRLVELLGLDDFRWSVGRH